MTKLIFLILFLPLFASAQDSVVVIPLWMGRAIESDLRLKDHLDTLTQILDQENGMLRRQIANKDSVILFDKVEARAIAGLCLSAEDSIRGLYIGEKKRRKGNGMQRDFFILLIIIEIWITSKH